MAYNQQNCHAASQAIQRAMARLHDDKILHTAMEIITKCDGLVHYRVRWLVLRSATGYLVPKWDGLLLQSKTSFSLYKVRWPVIAKRDSYVTIKFEALVQIGRLKPDIQTILQSWPNGFRRHFLFEVF